MLCFLQAKFSILLIKEGITVTNGVFISFKITETWLLMENTIRSVVNNMIEMTPFETADTSVKVLV